MWRPIDELLRDGSAAVLKRAGGFAVLGLGKSSGWGAFADANVFEPGKRGVFGLLVDESDALPSLDNSVAFWPRRAESPRNGSLVELGR